MINSFPEQKRVCQMDVLSSENAHQSGDCPLEDLDANILVSILKWLNPEEVAAATLTCKLLHQSAEASVVWRHLYDTALSSRVKEKLLPPPDQIMDWKGAVVRGRMLSALQFGVWERLAGSEGGPGGWAVRPCAREGHAAASWGRDSMILFGGWGSGIRNDLFILDRVYADAQDKPAAVAADPARPSTSEARPAAATSAAAAAGPSGSSSRSGQSVTGDSGPGQRAEARTEAEVTGAAPWLGPGELRPCSWQWRVPKVAGRRPAIRYGHSATRCGASGELLAVYGGMQAGGYTAEIASLAILRPFTGTLPGFEGCPGPGCEYEYEWYYPELSGADPGARGYHAACASEDGRKLYLFGGIADRDSITRLAVIDLTTGVVERPTTIGLGPSPRFGCSLVAYGRKLWVVGGGNGSDLARSGFDLDDIFTLDLATLEWSRLETTNRPHDVRVLGRCHASTRVGSKLVLFGGSLELGNDVTWLDLDARTWGRPAVVQGRPPGKRMSAVVALSGSDLLVFGGWIYSTGEMGDLSRLRLLPTERELRAAKQQAAASGAAAGAAGSSGAARGTGQGGSAAAQDDAEQLTELLSSKIARYYTLLRTAQECEENGGQVPLVLVRQMHEIMTATRLLRSRRRDGGFHDGGWFFDEDDDNDEEEEEEEDDEGAGARNGAGAAGGPMGGVEASDEEDEEEGGGLGYEPEYDSEETGEEETEQDDEEDDEGEEDVGDKEEEEEGEGVEQAADEQVKEEQELEGHPAEEEVDR